MKSSKLLYSLLFMAALAFAGCGDDDETQEDDMTGTWKVVQMNSHQVTTATSSEEDFSQISVSDGRLIGGEAFLTFTENTFSSTGTYTTESDNVTTRTLLGETTVDESSLQATVEDYNSEGTYTRVGNEITFNGILIELNLTDFEVDFDFGDEFGDEFDDEFGDGFDVEFGDLLDDLFEEVDLDELAGGPQTSILTITDFDGENMTLSFTDTFSDNSEGVQSTTEISQDVIMVKQ